MDKGKSRPLADQIEQVEQDSNLLPHAIKIFTDISTFGPLEPTDLTTPESAALALGTLQKRLDLLSEHKRKIALLKQLLAQQKFELEAQQAASSREPGNEN